MNSNEEIKAPLSKIFIISFLGFNSLFFFSLQISTSPNTKLSFKIFSFIHSPELSSIEFGKLHRHREISDWASSSNGSDHRRPFSPVLHIPNMDSREPSVCGPLISQPILLVPQRASLANINLGSDRGGPARTPHGFDDNGASVLQGAKVGVHVESRSFQRERARADYYLRKLGRG